MELKGYSGCRLCIIDYNGIKRVKKYSADADYNIRLQKQKEKQGKLHLKGFEQCRVYEDGREGELYFFVMDYVNGKTLAESMYELELDKIKSFTERISGNISPYTEPNKEADRMFKDKLISLREKLSGKMEWPLEGAFEILDSFSWEYVVASECHGDLTLQNILIQDNELYLIDCLDSFYDSWLIDLAKIFQDVDTMWSYRESNHVNSNLIIRLTIMRDLLIDKIQDMYMGEHLLETLYHVLLLNLVRIYPYLQDEYTADFLNEKLEYMMDKITRKSWRN